MPFLERLTPTRKQALAAAVSGLVFTLAFPPFNFWPLAFLGVIPLIHLARQCGALRSFALGWLFGTCLALGQLYWIFYVLTTYGGLGMGLGIWVLLMMVAVVGLYPGLFAAGLAITNRAGISPLLAVPILWAGSEWLKGLAITGFPWLPLGNGLIGALPLVQSAEIWGVFGVSALAAFINALLELAGWGLWRNRALRAREVAALAVVVILLGGGWLWGAARVEQVDARAHEAAKLWVSVVQGNLTIAQILDSEQNLPIIKREVALTEKAAAQVDGRPWLVVWPESSAPFYFVSEARPSIPVYRAAARLDAWILTGTMGSVERNGGYQASNRAWLVSPDGAPEGFYDKVHLVPFGEYVPLGDILFFVRALAAVGGGPGRRRRGRHSGHGRGEAGTFDLLRVHLSGVGPTAAPKGRTDHSEPDQRRLVRPHRGQLPAHEPSGSALRGKPHGLRPGGQHRGERLCGPGRAHQPGHRDSLPRMCAPPNCPFWTEPLFSMKPAM